MFQGKEAIRFCSDLSESVVRNKVRDALTGLGRVSIDPKGEIAIEPAERFNSFLAETALSGTLHREWNEYGVSVRYTCRPTPAAWFIVAAGTPLLLLGWLALLGPWSAGRAVAGATHQILRETRDELGGAAERRYGRKDMA
jgi:hypothetical protein